MEETASERVLEIAEREQDAAGKGEGEGDPVVEEDMHEGESGSADRDHDRGSGMRVEGCAGETVLQERAVAVEEEGAVDEALGVDGEERIAEHDGRPEARVVAEEDEEERGRVLADQDGDDGGSGEEEGEDLRELPAKGGGVPELAAIEGGTRQYFWDELGVGSH
jgi:hypothetical protein